MIERTDVLDDADVIGAELVTLMRSARDLHSVLVPEQGQPVLDRPAFGLLVSIAELGPVRLSVLSGRVCLDVSTVSRQIQDLEHCGWVVRERDPDDGRASLLRLTDAGRSVLQAGKEQRRRVLQQVLAGWPPDDLRALARHLGKFNAELAAFIRQENV